MTVKRTMLDQLPKPIRELVDEQAAIPGVLTVVPVPWDPWPASPNRTRGQHWGQRSQSDREAGMAAYWGYRAAGDPVLDVPIVVDVVSFRGGRLDEDNLRAALKPAADYLCKKRLVPDDTPEWVAWGSVRQEEYVGRPWVVLIVRARGPNGG